MPQDTGMGKELELGQEIRELKKKHGAVILAHYYQRPEIKQIADFVGDSLQLAQKAAGVDAGVIVFCGVILWRKALKSFHRRRRCFCLRRVQGAILPTEQPVRGCVLGKRRFRAVCGNLC